MLLPYWVLQPAGRPGLQALLEVQKVGADLIGGGQDDRKVRCLGRKGSSRTFCQAKYLDQWGPQYTSSARADKQ